MSVRKTASRSGRDYSGGANALKSLGVWALLAGASFIVGLFILSPLINVAAGSRTPETASKPQPAPVNNAAPAQHEEAPSVQKPAERQPDSDVGLSVEKPHSDTNSNVQQPSGVDDINSTNVREETSRSNRDRSSDESVSRTPDTETERESSSTPRTRRRNTDSETQREENTDGESIREKPANTEETKPRRHRSRSSESRRSSGESNTPPDVQKGEGIDR